MSVIVKGMEMPAKCCDCDAEQCDESFYGDELNHFCSFIYNGYTDNIRDRGRLNDCPIRPLPEKHGRLGDLDELQALFRECIDECKEWIQKVEDGGDVETILIARQSFNTFVEANLKTRKIPTIVEAEGDDS